MEEKRIIEVNGLKVVVSKSGIICKEDNTSFNRIFDSLEINGLLYPIKKLVILAFMNQDIDPDRIRIMNPKAKDKFALSNLRIVDKAPVEAVKEIPSSTKYCELWDVSEGTEVLWKEGVTFLVQDCALFLAEKLGYEPTKNKLDSIIANIRNCMRGDTDIMYGRYIALNVIDKDHTKEEKEFYEMQIESRKRYYNKDIFRYGKRLVFKGQDIKRCCTAIMKEGNTESSNYKFATEIIGRFFNDPEKSLKMDSLYRVNCFDRNNEITVKIYFDSNRNRQLQDYSHNSSCSIKEEKKLPMTKEIIEENIPDSTKEKETKGFRLRLGNKYIALVPTFADKELATAFDAKALSVSAVKELLDLGCSIEWIK